MKELSCKDAGVNCNFVAHGKTDDEVLKQISEHGKKVHGMKDADLANNAKKFRSLIHEERVSKK